jgi:hypothetical protein
LRRGSTRRQPSRTARFAGGCDFRPNSIRHTLDSHDAAARHDRPIGAQVNVAVQTNVNFDLSNLAERLIKKFDHEPELKGRIAQALLEVDDEQQIA